MCSPTFGFQEAAVGQLVCRCGTVNSRHLLIIDGINKCSDSVSDGAVEVDIAGGEGDGVSA